MAKDMDMTKALTYFIYSVVAMLIPSLVAMAPQFMEMLLNIPFVGTFSYMGISLLDVLLGAVGIGLIDQLLMQ